MNFLAHVISKLNSQRDFYPFGISEIENFLPEDYINSLIMELESSKEWLEEAWIYKENSDEVNLVNNAYPPLITHRVAH